MLAGKIVPVNLVSKALWILTAFVTARLPIHAVIAIIAATTVIYNSRLVDLNVKVHDSS